MSHKAIEPSYSQFRQPEALTSPEKQSTVCGDGLVSLNKARCPIDT